MFPEKKAQERQRAAEYKKAFDPFGARCRREEVRLTIRKQKKDEIVKKRRLAATTQPHAVAGQVSIAEQRQGMQHWLNILSDPSSHLENVLFATRQLRSLVSFEGCDLSTFQDFLDVTVRHLVSFLANANNEALILDSIWILTNIAASQHAWKLAEYGAIGPLVALLWNKDASAEIKGQVAWTLANLAGDSKTMRDLVLEAGALQPLLMNIQKESITNSNDLFLLRKVVWCVSVLTVWPLETDANGFMLDAAKEVITQFALTYQAMLPPCQGSEDIFDNIHWALSRLSGNKSNDAIEHTIHEHIMSFGMTTNLVNVLRQIISLQGSSRVAPWPIVRILGNFVAGYDEGHTQTVIDCGFLDHLPILMDSTNAYDIRKDACWMASNIAAGSKKQVDLLVSKTGVLESLVVRASPVERWQIRRYAILALAAICCHGAKNIMRVLDAGGLIPLVESLSYENQGANFMCDVLDGIRRIFEFIKGISDEGRISGFVQQFEELDGIERLEHLNDHPSEKVYAQATGILRDFLGGQDDDDDENENLAPKVNVSSKTFEFGISNQEFQQSAMRFGNCNRV
mmetsp:Transcript_13187/g.23700  ORF Transcript_13187/g.23700 Transcript_13187/m.23700 type:complete len:571 (-) Transcript_13187:160-1872(-)